MTLNDALRTCIYPNSLYNMDYPSAVQCHAYLTAMGQFKDNGIVLIGLAGGPVGMEMVQVADISPMPDASTPAMAYQLAFQNVDKDGNAVGEVRASLLSALPRYIAIYGYQLGTKTYFQDMGVTFDPYKVPAVLESVPLTLGGLFAKSGLKG